MALISAKSTELGIDIAQLALDAAPIQVCTLSGAFQCFCAGGKDHNIYLKDASGDQIHDGYFRYTNDVLAEGSSLATVAADFKAFIDAQEFVAMPVQEVMTPLV